MQNQDMDISEKKELLGKILIRRNRITDEQLKEALNIQSKENGLIGEIFVELGYLEEEDILAALIVQCGFPYITINSYSIAPEVLALIPVEKAKALCAIPLDRIDGVLSIVMLNPLDVEVRKELESIARCPVTPFIATRKEIEKAILDSYGL